jgi:tRNA A37 threonylcarbamoyladenosine dehydratase
MSDQFSRTRLLLGSEAMEKLFKARVCVFGIGGVGGYVCEALVRSGIGTIDIVDNDTVSVTNLNRQIIALHSTAGRLKTDVMEERMLDINPDVKVNKHNCFFLPETEEEFDFREYNYVVDAIDTVAGKIEIIMKADEVGVPVISSMGAGNKLDPSAFRVSDIYKTEMDPLARVMRRELRKRGIKKLKVVYSTEKPIEAGESDEVTAKRSVPGSIAFVPSAAGLMIAGEVIRDLANKNRV